MFGLLLVYKLGFESPEIILSMYVFRDGSRSNYPWKHLWFNMFKDLNQLKNNIIYVCI